MKLLPQFFFHSRTDHHNRFFFLCDVPNVWFHIRVHNIMHDLVSSWEKLNPIYSIVGFVALFRMGILTHSPRNAPEID